MEQLSVEQLKMELAWAYQNIQQTICQLYQNHCDYVYEKGWGSVDFSTFLNARKNNGDYFCRPQLNNKLNECYLKADRIIGMIKKREQKSIYGAVDKW